MSLELIGKFIAHDEIVSVNPSEEKTVAGNSVVTLTFKNGKEKDYPEKVLEYIVTAAPSDLTEVQQNLLTPAVRECLQVCMEYNLDFGDVDAFIKNLFTNINMQFARAQYILWRGDDDDFVPGFEPMMGVTLMDAHQVFIDNERNKSTESGESSATETAGD